MSRLYVKVASWHIVAATDRGGLIRTRCGLRARTEGTIASGLGIPTRISPTSDTLPIDEKSCESCLRLTLTDGSDV